MNRRSFLLSFTAAALALPSRASAAETWDIVYLWTENHGEALDYLSQLQGVLPDEDDARLVLVRDEAERYGVVLDLGAATRAEAAALAAQHDALLRASIDSDQPLAQPVAAAGYAPVYNIAYALSPDLDSLKATWARAAEALGPGVSARLFIEQNAGGRYVLVYKRYGDLASTRELAARHAALVAPVGLGAEAVPERGGTIVYGATTAGAPAPVTPDPEALEPLKDRYLSRRRLRKDLEEGRLKGEINAFVQGLRSRGQVEPDEKTSWVVYDLHHDRMLANLNGALPRQCASMVKPLVALAFFHEAKRGRFQYGPKSKAKFTEMIQHSSNTATDWAFKLLGGPGAVQRILTEEYGYLFRQVEVVETIGSSGQTYKNRASADDYQRFLRALWRDELPYSGEIKRLMNLPGRDRLYYGAPSIPPGTAVYNKTGSTSRLCGDMGVLVARVRDGKTFPYILVGIIEKETRASDYSSWIHDRGNVIRAVSDLTYQKLQRAYRLA